MWYIRSFDEGVSSGSIDLINSLQLCELIYPRHICSLYICMREGCDEQFHVRCKREREREREEIFIIRLRKRRVRAYLSIYQSSSEKRGFQDGTGINFLEQKYATEVSEREPSINQRSSLSPPHSALLMCYAPLLANERREKGTLGARGERRVWLLKESRKQFVFVKGVYISSAFQWKLFLKYTPTSQSHMQSYFS